MREMLVAQVKPLEEFMRDPVLAVACVLLIVVSIAWIVVSRMIVRNLKEAERMSARTARRRGAARSTRRRGAGKTEPLRRTRSGP